MKVKKASTFNTIILSRRIDSNTTISVRVKTRNQILKGEVEKLVALLDSLNQVENDEDDDLPVTFEVVDNDEDDEPLVAEVRRLWS